VSVRTWPLLVVSVMLALSVSAGARELPVRFFSIVDGLGDNRVKRIVVDSRGLLWICTGSGISRFDGSVFENFGLPQGLPFPAINDLIETPDGDFWLASNGGGVIRLRLSQAPHRYDAVAISAEPTSNRVNRLFRGPDGIMWAATDGGLFRMTNGADGRVAFVRVGLQRRGHPDEMVQVWAMAADREGSLWVGTRFGLVRLLPNGRIVSYPVRRDLENDDVFSLLYAPEDGVLWIGHRSGLVIFRPPQADVYSSEPGESPVEDLSLVRIMAGPAKSLDGPTELPHTGGRGLRFNTSHRGATPTVLDLVRRSSGAIRIVAPGGVWEWAHGRFATIDDPRLPTTLVATADDRDGNAWFATRAGGLIRVARYGFLTFRESDGLGPIVGRLFENRDGHLIVVSQDWRVSRFDGEAFHTVRVNVPAAVQRAGWRGDQSVIEDRTGDWWVATSAGLLRFSHVRSIDDLATRVPRVYTIRDGLPENGVGRVFEDSRGDIWSGGLNPGRAVLTRWDRPSGRFQRYSDTDGLRPFNSPTTFSEDRDGHVWITFRDGGIARYDGSRFRLLTEANGLPPGAIGAALFDQAGRFWCAGGLAGLYRIEDPHHEPLQPIFVVTPTQLRGPLISRIAPDGSGDFYATSAQGVVRIDGASTGGASGSARIAAVYTTNDGLAGSELVAAYADRRGRLWFSTTQGLSYLDPQRGWRGSVPAIRIAGLRVAGVDEPVSPAGEDLVSGLELTPGRTQLEIVFFGTSFGIGDTLSYEYRLVGASNDWSAPSPLRSVMFSNLAPGSYQFEVRAISAAGARSPQPARVAFRVLPPIWRRWWFETAATLLVLGAVTGFERYRAANRREISRAREERLAELEQVRRRIAADLHDEIGSSLTQISILSEVARQQGARVLPELNRPLGAIATSSRELVDAMSDIVWAINPAKDHLADLTQRMRRLAADTFTATNMTFRLELPPPDLEMTVGANTRREVFLIFKEGINNIVKHAACTDVVVKLGIDGHGLRLELHDNGRGFDPLVPSDGHGLASLRNRAAALGGTFSVVSAPGAGTSMTLHLPIAT